MIKIENVSKRYEGVDRKAVDSISLEVGKGEIYGFLGPNGAGKTTTMEMIVGILRPDEGDILVNGLSLEESPLKYKSNISYVPDNPEVYSKLRGIDYLNFISNVYGIAEEIREERILYYSRYFKIEDSLDDLIENYSRGMKQKIVLISALITDPELLILDEPMVGLDPESSYKLKEIIRERCARGKTVFFSTHTLEVAEEVCDRVGIINKGKLLISASIDDIRREMESEKSLESLFLELTRDE